MLYHIACCSIGIAVSGLISAGLPCYWVQVEIRCCFTRQLVCWGGALLEPQDLEGLFAKYWQAASPDSFHLTN